MGWSFYNNNGELLYTEDFAHINDASDAHDASAISILDSATDFTATDVEGALAEIQSDNEAHVVAADPHTGYVKETERLFLADFSKAGVLTTGTGTFRWYNDSGVTLTFREVRISAGTAPTGAAILVDVNNNGTTVFSTQSNRPTIAISGNTGTTTTFNDTTIADGEYLTIDIDQIGSTIAGSDLTVQVWMSMA